MRWQVAACLRCTLDADLRYGMSELLVTLYEAAMSLSMKVSIPAHPPCTARQNCGSPLTCHTPACRQPAWSRSPVTCCSGQPTSFVGLPFREHDVIQAHTCACRQPVWSRTQLPNPAYCARLWNASQSLCACGRQLWSWPQRRMLECCSAELWSAAPRWGLPYVACIPCPCRSRAWPGYGGSADLCLCLCVRLCISVHRLEQSG